MVKLYTAKGEHPSLLCRDWINTFSDAKVNLSSNRGDSTGLGKLEGITAKLPYNLKTLPHFISPDQCHAYDLQPKLKETLKQKEIWKS